MPTVLIVDDDEDTRLLIAMSLARMSGWRVLPASNGWEAIQVAASATPDAVLLDLVMPGMDGIATFAALQNDAATRLIPVVVLTAYRSVGPTQAVDDLGFAGVLRKPFSTRALPRQVAAILGWEPPTKLQSSTADLTARA